MRPNVCGEDFLASWDKNCTPEKLKMDNTGNYDLIFLIVCNFLLKLKGGYNLIIQQFSSTNSWNCYVSLIFPETSYLKSSSHTFMFYLKGIASLN